MKDGIHLTPYILYGEKLNSRGITSDMIENAKFIMYGAFGKDFFDDIQKKTESTLKNSIVKLFATHLLYQYLSTPIPKDILWLLETANTLESFSKSKNIGEYIKRLRSKDNCYPALFELLFAKHLKDKGYQVELQKLNNLGNPVEVSFTDRNGFNYWIECKTSEIEPPQETFSQKIERKLATLIESFPDGVGINIVISNHINGNDIVDDIIKEVSSILHEKKEYLSNLDVNAKIIFTFGEIQYIRFSKDTSKDIQEFFHKNSIEHRGKSTRRKENLEEDMKADPMTPIDNITKMFGIWYNTELLPKKKTPSGKKLLEDIKKKVSQQKNLLETNDEVIIVLEKENYEEIEIATFDIKGFSKYKNLSILLADYQTDEINGKIIKKYTFLIKSSGLVKNVTI